MEWYGQENPTSLPPHPPHVGQGLLIIEALLSNSGLLWISNQPDTWASPLSPTFTIIFLFAPLELSSQKSIRLEKKNRMATPPPIVKPMALALLDLEDEDTTLP